MPAPYEKVKEALRAAPRRRLVTGTGFIGAHLAERLPGIVAHCAPESAGAAVGVARAGARGDRATQPVSLPGVPR